MKKNSSIVSCLAVATLLMGCGGDPEEDNEALPSPELAEKLEVGGTLGAVAVAGGDVWVVDEAAGAVVRLDSQGEPKGRPIEIEGGPAFVAGAEESVWVASGSGAITRIDSTSGEATAFAKADPQPGGIAAAGDFVWVTNPSGDTVAQIDADTGRSVTDHPVGDLPTDIAITGGSVWVANTNDGSVSRIAPESGEVSEPVAVADQQVLALSADEDGIWVAGTDDERIESVDVFRIDPSDDSLSESSATLESGLPVRLATGEGGAWAMLAGPALEGEGTVLLIDPETGEPSGDPISVGGQPRGIVAGEGSVWITDAEGTVTRIAASD